MGVMAALVLLLALPNNSAGQARNRDGNDNGGSSGGSSQAVPRNQAPAPPPAAAPAPAPAPTAQQRAVPRATPRTTETTGSGSTATSQQNRGARPRGGRPTVGTAVPRGSVPAPRVNVRPQVRYYRGYSPWGFSGLGFGSYYGSFYDPYVFYNPYSPWYGSYGSYGSYGGYGYSPYGYGYPSAYSYPADGELRLKIRPRDAQVFVEGYYVGIVDDFDGVFQRLHLPSGPHRIEVRAPGYETLTFDVQILFNRTTKFEGDLRRIR